jgi:hypothetical protein
MEWRHHTWLIWSEVLVTGPISQQGPLYGIGCHNPSGLPITFHHSKASLKHIYFLNAMAILKKLEIFADVKRV